MNQQEQEQEQPYVPKHPPQTEFLIRESGEVSYKGDASPETVTQILDVAQIRNSRFREMQQKQIQETNIIAIVMIIVGFFVLFTATLTVVHQISIAFAHVTHTTTQEN